jgi:hypothetical protein
MSVRFASLSGFCSRKIRYPQEGIGVSHDGAISVQKDVCAPGHSVVKLCCNSDRVLSRPSCGHGTVIGSGLGTRPVLSADRPCEARVIFSSTGHGTQDTGMPRDPRQLISIAITVDTYNEKENRS